MFDHNKKQGDTILYGCRSDEDHWSNVTIIVEPNFPGKMEVADLTVESPQQIENRDEMNENSGLDDNEAYGVVHHEPDLPSWKKESDMVKMVYKPAGNLFRMRCAASGFPEPNVTWTKNNESIIARSSGKVKMNKWAITLDELIPADSGNYTCTACNEWGCINHTTKLEVQG